MFWFFFFFFQAEDGIRDLTVTGVQTCALPISWSAAPVMPWAPPTTVTRPRSPLCIVGVSFGSRAPAHPSVTSRGHTGSAGGGPVSTPPTFPPPPPARRVPPAGPPHRPHHSPRTGPPTSP